MDAMTFYERAVAVERSWRLVPERCYACGRVFPSVAVLEYHLWSRGDDHAH